MTSPAVEARSLSSLTALASNPPAYPRNPTHVRHDPLVLYIARVPGSKDVFLSPMKPREKVVTAEDIQSSLYYVHVDQPEDGNLVAPPVFQDPDYSGQIQPSLNRSLPPPVQRKAVPGVGGGVPVRKPKAGMLAPMSNYESIQNASAGDYAQRPGLLAPNYNSRRSFDSTQHRQENLNPAGTPRGYPDRPQPTGTSFTLIRRDPASSAQWNVARIDDPPVDDISSSNLTDPTARKKMGAPMYIEILNPGYSKFLHSNHTEKLNDTSRQSLQPQPQASNEPSVTANIFRRRLWMEGSQYSNGGFGHRKNSSYDSGPEQFDSSNGPPSFLTHDNQSYNTIQLSDRQTNFRGYVFTSPWNGRCEFITGAAGGSLKCRHLVPGLQGAPPATMQVSELRFNLPSSSKVATPRGEESSKRPSFFHRGRHSRNNSSVSVNRNDSVEDVRNSLDRLDLSLGQEFAGGGFGGKQAKLGKIIIEDEGLKMMDLLVAANLGLWWRAYEKASNVSRGDRGSF